MILHVGVSFQKFGVVNPPPKMDGGIINGKAYEQMG